jgi:glycosyltransferase involved in cell wall biosynthesis
LTPITDGYIAVAESHGRFLVEHERFPAGKVFVIPNGVDTERFSPRLDRGSIRRELGLGTAAPVVTMVAALRPEKNHEMLLEAAALVVRKVSDVQFLIVGDGPRRAELEQLAANLKCQERVHFLGSRNDVPQILAATDVFALTSHNEANPVSILEALSMACPVVATDVGSVRETVASNETGLLIQAGNSRSFADGLIKLILDPLERQRMGRAGRQQVVERSSVQAMVRGYERLIERIFAAKRGLVARAAEVHNEIDTNTGFACATGIT